MAHTHGHKRASSMIKFADLDRTIRRAGVHPIANPPHQQQLNSGQSQSQQVAETLKKELHKRQSRIPTDKEIPDGVEGLVLEDAASCYRNLRDVEKRLDAIMMRKRLDSQEMASRAKARHKTMRIWISNTVENQPWQQATDMDHEAFDFGDSSLQATYRVKIEGRLLDDDEGMLLQQDDTSAAGDGEKSVLGASAQPGARSKFSRFFKQITVDFERSPALQPDGIAQVEWKKPPPTAEDTSFDCLEFERKGDENMNITINLVSDELPERYKLSPALANLLDREVDDRAGVLMGIWAHIRHHRLHEDDDMRRVRCDAKLQAVFGHESFLIPKIPEVIQEHLSPLDPIKLRYTIRVDQAFQQQHQQALQQQQQNTPDAPLPTIPSTATIYDVTVLTDDPIRKVIEPYLASTHNAQALTALARLDDQIALAVQAMQHAKAKHTFLTSMARDPVNFIKRWVASQSRDMDVLLGGATRGQAEEGVSEEWRRGGEEGVWGGDVARESVALFLARQKMAP